MPIRDLITKKVLSIYDGEICGYVLGVKFEDKMQGISSVVVANDNEDLEYSLKMRDVINANNEYVMIRNKTKLSVIVDSKCYNLNSEIVGVDGINYGTFEDLIMTKNYKISKILCKNKEFSPKNIINMGENVIIVNDTNKKYNRSNFAPVQRLENNTNNTQTVEIMPHNTLPTPVRVSNTASLLGRRLGKDLVNSNGEVIARKNSVITIPLINSAKQFNIMADLIQFVK